MKFAITALVAGLFAGASQAEVITYDCSLHNLEQGWIPERVILSVDAENKRARVYDVYIHELDGQPKDTKFKTTRKGEYRMTWKMNIPMSQGGTAYVSYTATLNPKTQKLNLLARFPQVNATNRPRGDGPCNAGKTESLYGS
jgi:hypothetical protein